MQTATYDVEARVQERHWWFRGRRVLFSREISKLDVQADQPVLDIGTSTGTNLRLLRKDGFRNIKGLDQSTLAVSYCAEKGFGFVDQGSVDALPYGSDSFDLVLCTDVLEHIDDDSQALKEIERVLKPGGFVLITVPAFMGLWGLQDDVSDHKRRYVRSELRKVIANSGLLVRRCYYFNFFLFGPIWLARRLIRLFRLNLKSENELNTSFLNRILFAVFTVDVSLAPVVHVPFGVSILVVAQKETDDHS